jgi:quinolinate synthase
MKIEEKISLLKRERNAIIVAHNFQPGEIQDIADIVGGKLELARAVAESDAKVVVSCGVLFMAELIALFSPEKTILQPDLAAGCPMIVMMPPKELKKLREEHPEAKVVSYIKTSAEQKALSDYCCPFEKAMDIVRSLDGEVIFATDAYLGEYISSKTGKDLIYCEGFCPPHVRIMPQEIQKLKEKHPTAEVLVHPQCRPDVVDMADVIADTEGICKRVSVSNSREFIIASEVGILHRLRKENPEKVFYHPSDIAVCRNHKIIDLDKVYWSLKELKYQVHIDDGIAQKAREALVRGGAFTAV